MSLLYTVSLSYSGVNTSQLFTTNLSIIVVISKFPESVSVAIGLWFYNLE